MPNQISIRGQVLMAPSKMPLANSKVELWDSSGPYGLIATTNTDATGNFTFLVNDPVAGLILQQSIVPQYKAYSGVTLLTSATMAYNPETSVVININQGTYDAAIPDTEVSVTPINYITVQGTITDAAAKPSVNTAVNIYENGINNKYLLAAVQTDAHGYYQAKISSRLINNTVVLTKRSIRVEALDPTGIFIASNDIFEWHDVLIVNLSLNSVNTLSEFENVRNAVATVTAGLPISSLRVDTVNNIDQLRYASGATSHKSSAVQNIVAAHKYADEHGQPPELFYALTKTTGSTVHPWLSMTVSDIKYSVQTAAENGVMPASSLNNLSSFIQSAQAYQVTATQAIPITGEAHTLNDALQAGLGSAANVSSFLTEYNNQTFDDINDFWTSYTANYGANATQTAQTTLQLAGLTCFQPLMISALTNNLRGAHISQLAAWTAAQWLQFIQNVCSTNNTLAVPASIRGSITDPNNIDVQTQYAQTLADIAQKMYPLTNISSQLQGNNGSKLIQDSNARSQVITFIGNNPYFDPIKNSVHDIGSSVYNFNLSGISDVNALASALKPFVTVSKITGGNPTATAAMIMNGHNSALAISQLSRDEFVSLYGSSFAPMSVAHNEDGMFVGSHSGTPTPAMTTALTAHTTAAITTHYALHSLLSARNNLSLPANGALANFGGVIDTVAATADPDLATMFGSLDFCNCEMCSSLYSPSAYLADILNFIGKKASAPLVGGFTPAYNELVNRRPDIANIDLSCKNANTPVPYIDLVNELLESMILRQLPAGTVATLPSSYQTTGTQVELAAYPEHKYRLTGGTTYSDYNDFAYVYNNILNNAGYPYNLPFSLPIEETRSYLKYLGKSRYDMMRLFLPPSQQSNYAVPTSDVVSNYSIFTEWLGITQNAASIITATTGSSTPWLYYGLNHSDNTGGLQNGIQDPEDSSVILKGLWTTLLTSRVDVLLKQTGLSYEELLQFLNTSFLNNGNNITIAPHSGAPANTCQLNLLQLNFAGTATPAGFLGNLYRAILLYRTKKMDINKWDVLFRALNISSLNQSDYQLLGRVMLLANRLGMAPEIVAGWWQNLDNVQYTDYNSDTLDIMPTVYGSIFGNKSIINDPANAIFSNPASLPSQYLNNTASIAGFCRIREDEVITILNFLGITNLSTTAVTWTALSRLYIIAQIAKSAGYSIQDFVTIMQLCQTQVYLSNPPYTVGSTTYQISDFLNNLQSVLDYIDTIKTSGFSVAEINYLIGNIDTENIYTPNVSSIQLFLEALRSELQKFPLYTGSNPTLLNQLINVVYQQFSKQFNVSSDWIASIINPGGTNTGVILEFINSIFVISAYDLSETTIQYLDLQYPTLGSPYTITSGPYSGTKLPGFLLSDFYLTYRRVYKVIYIANKLRLRNQEFEYFYLNPSRVTSAFSIFDFTLLQVAVDSNLNLLPTVSPAPLLNGLLRLGLWAQVRNKLSLPEDGLGKLIDAAYTIVPAKPGAALNVPITTSDSIYFTDLNTCFSNWKAIVNNTSWGTILTELIGTAITPVGATTNSTPAGILNVVYSCDFNPSDIGTVNYSDFAPNDIKKIQFILNIVEIISWCQHTGLSPASIQKALLANIALSDSHKILLAAKGKQTDEDWEKIAKPLRDTIRKKQRDALVSYILANPSSGNLYKWQTANDLYAYLLIDVEMEPVMLTSRISQAISSVQLFVDRVIMNMEYSGGNTASQISVSLDFIAQWKQWRQWYNIWEANRQIFLYPENWLQPELRDDKSYFFKQLETELLQQSVTEDSVEEAVINYLGKLQEVARMEPVGCCDEIDPYTNQTITHIFARSQGDPQHYYMSHLIADLWTPWEEINLNIKSDNIVPVVWDNKLHLYWLTFKEKRAKIRKDDVQTVWNNDSYKWAEWFHNDQSEVNVEGVNTNDSDSSDAYVFYNQIEVTINWSEYKDGKWLKPKAGKDRMLLKLNPYLESFKKKDGSIWVGSLNNCFDTSTNPWGTADFYERLTKHRELTVPQLAESRIFINPFIPSSTNNFIPGDTDNLYLMLYFTVNPFDRRENAQYLHSFRFKDSFSEPEVVRNNSFLWNITAPINTAFYNNNFIECASSNASNTTNLPLKVDNYVSGVTGWPNSYYYNYYNQSFISNHSIRVRSNSSSILRQTPNGFFELTTKSNFNTNPLENQFFFEDNNNTFFIRKIKATTTVSSAISIGAASYAAATNYPVVQTGLLSHAGWGSTTVSSSYPSAPSSTIFAGSSTMTAPPTEVNYYYFQTCYHPHVGDFIQALNKNGIDGLLNTSMQSFGDTMNFASTYSPTGLVYNQYPTSQVDFSYGGIYSIYNWELFFHLPIMVAKRLSENQQFAEAQKWYHYIFDPTSNTDVNGVISTSKQRFWKFKPFYDLAGQPMQTLSDLMSQISSNNMDAVKQINNWQQNPFDPYAVSRLRIEAFMKNVVMSYIDNLIAWGDQLFTQDTLESINHATQLYVLASNILGDKPKDIPCAKQPTPSSFHDLVGTGTLDAFSNALVAVESHITPITPLSATPVTYTAASLGFSGLTSLPSVSAGSLRGSTSTALVSGRATGLITASISAVAAPGSLSAVSIGSPGSATARTTGAALVSGTALMAPASRVSSLTPLPATTSALGFPGVPLPSDPTMFYFCLPDNEQLLEYWNTIADRLYKIRNSLNIAGQAQQLPLFDPLINPALLVRAAAAGVDINSVLNDISNVNLPYYRFNYVLQKANELCNDVKSLGSALLSALEKQDAEQLSLLRSGLEYKVLQSMLQVKQSQLNEANASLEALTQSKVVTQARYDYYNSRQYMNPKEQEYFNSIKTGMVLQAVQGEMSMLASSLSLIPQFHAQGAFAIGVSMGGQHIGAAMNAISAQLGVLAGINNAKGNMANLLGGYDRRQDDWRYQASAAQLELVQIDKQIDAANIRIATAQYELDNQQLQIDNNRTVDDFMRTKYTNADLYNWMIGQISTTYFQAYQLAYQLANKAGQCYDFELPYASQPSSQFIQFGYWDSLKKGLLAGEKLQFDLRKLEAAYMDSNKRLLELTKHVSLAMFAPDKLIALRETGSCTFTLPEDLFDLDYPGHYYRTIKSISVSIPCVAGPYTTVPCTLAASSPSYVRTSYNSAASALTAVHNVPCQLIATSSAQNDNGMFDFSFRDERYLPFEGIGAISQWSLTLGGITAQDGTKTVHLSPFDFETISDVVLHIKYTAMDGSTSIDLNPSASTTFGQSRSTQVYTDVKNSIIANNTDILGVKVPLQRIFSMRHEFSNGWYAYATAFPSNNSSAIGFSIGNDQFPFFCNNNAVAVNNFYVQLVFKSPFPNSDSYELDITYTDPITSSVVTKTIGNLSNSSHAGSVTISTGISIPANALSFSMVCKDSITHNAINMDTYFADVLLVATYSVSAA